MTRAILRTLRADLWQAPRAHGDILLDRTVGPLELFYDLVVVVLIAQAGRHLASNLSARGLCEFGVIFVLVWITWFNGTLLHELHGRDDVRSRNIFLGQILLLVPLGALVPGAGDVHGGAFAVDDALLFLLLAFLWSRASRGDTPDFRPATKLYVGATLISAATMAASAPLPADTRLIVWAILAVLYLASVGIVFAVGPARLEDAIVVTDALIERFGLFVIIVLGETVTGVVGGLSTDPTDPNKLVVGIVAVVVGFGSWWMYFDFVGHRVPGRSRLSTVSWLLGHLPVSAATAAMGASTAFLVEHAAAHRTAMIPTWVLCGGAVGLLVFTNVLMTSLEDWHSAASLLRPVAFANLVSAAFAVAIGLLRPPPLILGLLLVITFGAPWMFAVLRRAILGATPSP